MRPREGETCLVVKLEVDGGRTAFVQMTEGELSVGEEVFTRAEAAAGREGGKYLGMKVVEVVASGLTFDEAGGLASYLNTHRLEGGDAR